MQNVYAYYFKAKQKSGKPSLFIYFEAKNDARALRDLENKIEDADLDPKEYFKPVRTNFPVVDDLPIEGVFSEPWCDRYCLGDDGLTWELIVTEPKQQLPQKNTKSQAKKEAEFFATNLDKHTVIAAAWLYGRDYLKLSAEQLKSAQTLVMDDSLRYPQNVIMALSSLKGFEVVYPEMPIIAIAAIKAVWLPFGKAPELGKISQFATEYLNAKVDERQSIISKWQINPGSTAPNSQPEELQRATSGALASSVKKLLHGTPMASFGELETVIYLAHYPSDFDMANPPGSIINATKEMKARKDKSPIVWFGQLRESPGILGFSREAVSKLIRNAPENIYLTPGALLTYINANLIEIDEKATKAITNDQTQSLPKSAAAPMANEQSSHETLAGAAAGTGDAALAGELTNQASSFEGEKEEVDAIEDLEPTTRSAWLRREILTALEGKTSVMSVIDVEELIVNTDGKEERCQVINERVEYYLGEKPQGSSTTSDTESPSLTKVGKGIYDASALFTESPLAGVVVDNGAAANDVREFLETPTAQNDETAVTDAQTEEPETTGEPPYFDPGRYTDISNADYHRANGISSTMLKDARVSLMYFNARHVDKTIKKVHSKVLDLGNLVHTMALEPEKLDQDFSIEPIIPKGAFTTTASMREFIHKHNTSLPKMTDSDTLRSIIDTHNATLPTPYALGGNADEIGQFYTLLPVEFQRIGEDQKPTATAMKACIKEYNSTLPTPLKTSGGRETLLEQLESIDPEFVKLERAIPSPLAVSGSKEDMAVRIKVVLPTAVFADELIEQWRNADDDRILVTQQQMQEAKAIQHALFNHPSSGPMLQHSQRTVEASYFGYDEDTGMEIRVRPDLEIDLDGVRIGFDLKTISMWNVKQGAVRARLHREIIERDYHLSAAMYSDVAAFDQFFWIFVNKDEGYNWVAIVEASPDLLELGRLEYKQVLRDIKQAYDTNIWPAPITEEIVDDLNDFDRRRLEALRVA